MASISQGCPARCTGMIALVLSVILRRMSSGSMLYVLGSMSAKTGVPPQYSTQLADAANVIGVVITSSPGPIPAAWHAACSAAVSFEMATAYFAPTYSATARSNSATFGPVVRKSDFSTFTTSSISSSSIVCLPYGIITVPPCCTFPVPSLPSYCRNTECPYFPSASACERI